MPLGLSFLRLFVLLLLLLLQDLLYVLPVKTVSSLVLQLICSAFLHQVFHHVPDFLHEERH